MGVLPAEISDAEENKIHWVGVDNIDALCYASSFLRVCRLDEENLIDVISKLPRQVHKSEGSRELAKQSEQRVCILAAVQRNDRVCV